MEARYDAYASGPDEYSTYASCFGADAGRGDEVALGVSLAVAIDAAQRDGRAVDIYRRTRLGSELIGTYYDGEPNAQMRAWLARRDRG